MSADPSLIGPGTERPAACSEVPPPTAPRGYRVPAGLWLFFAFKSASIGLLLFHHPLAALTAFVIPDPWFLSQFLIPTTRGLGPVVTRFTTTRREVWLTIDDGPDPATTPKVLALLAAHRARATFFVIGEKVSRHPELVVEILRQGHSIGNHSHRHASPTFW